MKYLIGIPVLFSVIILIEVSIISIAAGSVPNNIELTLLHNVEMFMSLFNINPAVAIKLILINQPLLIIEKVDVSTSTQLWGLYLMPVSALGLAMLCLFFTILPVKLLSRYQWSWIIASSTGLLVSILYLRVQACCTANPAWLIDVMLLSRIFNPEYNVVFWQEVYLTISPWFSRLQYILASVSLLLLYFSSRGSFKKVTD